MSAEAAARALPYLRQEGRHELVVRALDPPCFGPDGAAVRLRDGGHAAAWLPG